MCQETLRIPTSRHFVFFTEQFVFQAPYVEILHDDVEKNGAFSKKYIYFPVVIF